MSFLYDLHLQKCWFKPVLRFEVCLLTNQTVLYTELWYLNMLIEANKKLEHNINFRHCAAHAFWCQPKVTIVYLPAACCNNINAVNYSCLTDIKLHVRHSVYDLCLGYLSN